jgi:hypothetical protein
MGGMARRWSRRLSCRFPVPARPASTHGNGRDRNQDGGAGVPAMAGATSSTARNQGSRRSAIMRERASGGGFASTLAVLRVGTGNSVSSGRRRPEDPASESRPGLADDPPHDHRHPLSQPQECCCTIDFSTTGVAAYYGRGFATSPTAINTIDRKPRATHP